MHLNISKSNLLISWGPTERGWNLVDNSMHLIKVIESTYNCFYLSLKAGFEVGNIWHQGSLGSDFNEKAKGTAISG